MIKYLLLFMFLSNCGLPNNQEKKNITAEINSYKKFLENLKEKSLPFEVIPTLDNEFDFNRKINLNDVKEFLCKDKTESCIEQPTGGYYNYYYSNYFIIKGFNFDLISYYRISDDYEEYIIVTLSRDGKIIDNLNIAGQLNDQSQKDALITDKLEIITSEIIVNNRITDNVFNGKKLKSYYVINKDGLFVFSRKDEEKTGKYEFLKGNNRLVEIK